MPTNVLYKYSSRQLKGATTNVWNETLVMNSDEINRFFEHFLLLASKLQLSHYTTVLTYLRIKVRN